MSGLQGRWTDISGSTYPAGQARVMTAKKTRRQRLGGRRFITRLLLPLVVLSVVLTGTAKAEYHLIGPEGLSCGSWTRAHDGLPTEAIMIREGWVLGFLSAFGYLTYGDPLNGMDGAGVAAWIDNYCRDHPIDDIADAAIAFSKIHPR